MHRSSSHNRSDNSGKSSKSLPRQREYKRSSRSSSKDRGISYRSKKRSSNKSHRARRSRSKSRSPSYSKKRSYDRSPQSYRKNSRYEKSSSSQIKKKNYLEFDRRQHNRSRSSSITSGSGNSDSNLSSPKSNFNSDSNEKQDRKLDLKVLENQLDQKVIDQIDADTFTPKTFVGTKKLPDKVIIDLRNETVSMESVEKEKSDEPVSTFNSNFFGEEVQKMDRWIKKLFTYRQRYFVQE